MQKPIQHIIRPLDDMQHRIAKHLQAVKMMFNPGSVVTLVVRNPNMANADLVMSEETNFDDLIAAIRTLNPKKPTELNG